MVDFCREGHFGRLKWIVRREMDVEEENSLVIRRIFGSHDRCRPKELLAVVGRAGRTVGRWVPSKVDELFLDSFQRHNKNIMINEIVC